MSTFGLSFVGRFVLFRSVLYLRFHCIEKLFFEGQKVLAIWDLGKSLLFGDSFAAGSSELYITLTSSP